ncbi:MAG: HAMP domain-containing histidine kinase [Labilithrix sp.]|nr:HAMP domain-containing histidine kinase [Labilithrix sp.]MBX3224298.1 HAMP domain-containing histidine kinase [Labilithrix sp.]
MSWIRMRLPTRLGITHGALVALLIVLLVVTLQGLLRMLGVMTMISDQRLTRLDAEEELHRSAWDIEVALRHSRIACADGAPDEVARGRIARARVTFSDVFARHGAAAPARLRDNALAYGVLADDALSTQTCPFLSLSSTEERRMTLDEEMTDTWIDRLHELHADIQTKEKSARAIGTRTATNGVVVAILGVVAAVFVATLTARSVTRPIARLAADATRLGDGDFTPIKPVGGPPEIDELRRDLERTREKLLGVDRLKQAFLASVSHELRSPLGRLREALALLGDGTVGELTARQGRVLTLARNACEQEVRIVEALLDMSRVSSGLPVQRQAGCDIEKVVEAAVDAERPAAVDRGVEIRVEQADKAPTLRLDSALVERAVANLVRNAVSVSPRNGEVRVRIGVRPDHERRVVMIDVVDDGPGLSDVVAGRIFEPFNAAQVADRPAGIGLGLSLAREVARAHGGDLDLARGEGSTTFRMEIPVGTEEQA